MKKPSRAVIILSVLLVAVSGFAILLYLSASSLVDERNNLRHELSTMKNELSTMRNQLPSDSLDAIKAEELINAERVKAGLQPLIHSERLKAAACAKLDHMAVNDYWAHTSPNGVEPWHFFRLVSYQYYKAGENLALGQVAELGLVNNWLASPSHKENIMGDYVEQAICTKAVKYHGSYPNMTVSLFRQTHIELLSPSSKSPRI